MPKSMKGVMREFKQGQLHSGSKKGPVVKNRKQAIAIGLSERRQMGKKVPPKPKYDGEPEEAIEQNPSFGSYLLGGRR